MKALLVVAAILFCVGPFAVQFLTSVDPDAELGSRFPTPPTLSAYATVLSNPTFLRSLWNSFLVATVTTVLSVLLGGMAAFSLAKLNVPGKRWVLAATLAVSMLPPVATVSPIFLALRALGLRDFAPGLILPYTGFALPLALWLLTAFFEELPDELFQAARMDGCSPVQTLRHVYLPLAGPGLASTALLVFVFAWNEFLFALTLTSSPEQRTVPVAVSLFASTQKEPFAELAAASVLVTLPLIVLTLVFQKRIVAGLTAGAVKA